MLNSPTDRTHQLTLTQGKNTTPSKDDVKKESFLDKNILKDLAGLENVIPELYKDEVHKAIFKIVYDSSLDLQYYLDRLNEYHGFSFEVRIVKVKSNS